MDTPGTSFTLDRSLPAVRERHTEIFMQQLRICNRTSVFAAPLSFGSQLTYHVRSPNPDGEFLSQWTPSATFSHQSVLSFLLTSSVDSDPRIRTDFNHSALHDPHAAGFASLPPATFEGSVATHDHLGLRFPTEP